MTGLLRPNMTGCSAPCAPSLSASSPLSLRSVCQVLDYFKLPVSAVLVIVDEVALDLGQVRLRSSGSAGGHNGLKSIESHLKTKEYARLRVGVGAGERVADRIFGTCAWLYRWVVWCSHVIGKAKVTGNGSTFN